MRRPSFFLFLCALLFSTIVSRAQTTRRVLFLGNSYTGVNNLPQIVHDVAQSAGDVLIFDKYNPGGYTLEDHLADVVTQNKLLTGNWDYVVLQEQSQRPITHTSKFNNAANALDKLVTQHSFCGGTMLYMTWGRKNGDPVNCPSFPVMCTYEGMDSTLRNNYLNLASNLHAEVSPVGAVWHYLRQNHAGIELYLSDESHPTTAGSFAAACCFYATIFKKDPTLIAFNFGLSANDASAIKNAAKTVAYLQPQAWDFRTPPTSHFWYTIGAGTNEVQLVNINVAESFLWNFGDGSTSSIRNPSHSYATDGTYTINLKTSICDVNGLLTSTFDTTVTFCSHTPTIFTVNPWVCSQDTLWTDSAHAYQWYAERKSIPETGRFIADYSKYGTSFSVASTFNGCTELSQPYSFIPDWSGYYFDIWPGADPCEGDSVPFAVLHSNGFLSGSEIIRWYLNHQLLSAMNDEDTLWIKDEGIYECKVVNPSDLHCPLDTTAYLYEVDCGQTGVIHNISTIGFRIFPNPATETLTIESKSGTVINKVQVYNNTGLFIDEYEVVENNTIDLHDLPSGIYLMRLPDSKGGTVKFMKR